MSLALVLLAVGIVVFAYGFVGLYDFGNEASVFRWLWRCWSDPRADYEHGFLIPVAAAYLVIRKRKEIARLEVKPALWGGALVLLGILIYIAAARTIQARVAVVSLPVVIVGAAAFVHSGALARILCFPAFLILFGVPVPGLTQATNDLQILASKGAYHFVGALGIDAIIQGNNLFSATDAWGFNVAEGCSGIRSLMALTLIAAVYGSITQDRLWKCVLLFACSFPLAIIANIFRVSSVIIVAEFYDPEFAGSLYHDYSGFLFFPIGLAGLVLCGMLINLKKSWGARRVRRLVRSNNKTPSHAR